MLWYFLNVSRYVDKMLEMIAVAGDFVAGAVWHRIIQIVTNHKDLQVKAGFDLCLWRSCFSLSGFSSGFSY